MSFNLVRFKNERLIDRQLMQLSMISILIVARAWRWVNLDMYLAMTNALKERGEEKVYSPSPSIFSYGCQKKISYEPKYLNKVHERSIARQYNREREFNEKFIRFTQVIWIFMIILGEHTLMYHVKLIYLLY